MVEAGRPRIIQVEGAEILPSMVGLVDDGSLLVGRAARNQYALYPERTVRSVKRRMDEDVRLPMGEQDYTPQEISALILRRLKQAAEEVLGQPVTKAVITVPAYFSDAQRQATREAGRLADLEVVRIINEPTAAALTYEVEHKEPKNILVYDLGGGTFDVSVVRLNQDVTEVLASHGNNHLGGDDFDAKLVEQVTAHLKEHSGLDPSDDRSAMARIVRACKAAKIALSDAPFARIEEEYLLEQDGEPVHLSLELERSEYEDIITAYIDETLEAVHIVLKGAGLTATDIREILLVGGATRTPLIRQRLERELGMQPRSEPDPDLCVATGAAIQAAVVSGQQVAGVLVDVTPYTFGTSAWSDLNGEPYPYTFIPLIRKNTPIPVTKSDVFQTMHDGQRTIEVQIYQGEDPDALNNTKIGSFRIEGLSDVPAGNVIVTTFALDVNGILNATARFEKEELEAARERLSVLTEGEIQDNAIPERRETVQTQALIEVNLVESVRDALADDDAEATEQAVAELSDLIYYLES